MNLQMFKLVLEEAEEPEIKLPTSAGSLKKQESSRKTSISALLTMAKPLTVWITTDCGKFWKRWEYQTTWPPSWETYMQVRKQQLELDMEQQTGSKLGKEYDKAEYCHPARWCCESAALNMPANLENSAVATGLEKFCFHSNPTERQYQRMFKHLHNCTHLTH